MPAERLSMRKIKEILRLKWASGLSNRKIAHSCGIARPTVNEYLRRAEQAGLSWPLSDEWEDTKQSVDFYHIIIKTCGLRTCMTGIGGENDWAKRGK